MTPEMDSSASAFSMSFGEEFVFRKTSSDSNGELLRIETRLDPGVRRPLHAHPHQEERFFVQEGVLGLAVDTREVLLEAGDEYTIHAGTPHTIWRAGDGPTVMITEHRPALRFEDFLQAMVQLDMANRLNEAGMPAHLFDAAALLTEFREEMRPTDVPRVVQRRIFPLLAHLGTLLGREVPGYSAPLSV
jgi:mannose-6-phosphate isomerase-like protein (cupin superfamily)